jgi:hypothetical protein
MQAKNISPEEQMCFPIEETDEPGASVYIDEPVLKRVAAGKEAGRRCWFTGHCRCKAEGAEGPSLQARITW